MKLQALLVAIAVAAGGSAFAATHTAKAEAKDTASTQTTTTKKTTKVKKTKVKKTKSMHASSRDSARQMMGGSSAPDTDLTASDRQSRVDEAYSKWRSTNPQ